MRASNGAKTALARCPLIDADGRLPVARLPPGRRRWAMEVSSRQREAGENAGGQFIRNWCEEPGIMVKERLLHSIHIHSRRLSGISLVDVTLTLSRMETPVM